MLNKTKQMRAFSFSEVAVIIFLIVAVVCVFFGKVFDVSQESEVIYRWKHVLSASQYSYKVALLTQKNVLEEALKLEPHQRNEKLLALLRSGMNFNDIKVVKKKPLKNYKYRFLNGLRVNEDSKYYVKNFKHSPGGKILVGLNWTNPNCFETKDSCGVIIFDLNGVARPNRFGLDIFGVNIYDDRLEPFGSGLSYSENEKNCRRFETGVTCSRFYLMGGQFFK